MNVSCSFRQEIQQQIISAMEPIMFSKNDRLFYLARGQTIGNMFGIKMEKL